MNGGGGRARILVVDDDPGMRRAVHRILSPAYEVETLSGEQAARERLGLPTPGRARYAGGTMDSAGAAGGRSGFSVGSAGGAVSQPGGSAGGAAAPAGTDGDFALALIDVRLADGDGYHLCQAIRERRPLTDIILITGSLSEPDEKLYRSLEEGAFYFLFKPFDRRVLLALVERCLRLQAERGAKERYASTLAADLERARRFQRSLLPRGAVAAAGWRLEGRLLSCDALGGDLYQAQVLAEGEGVVWAVSDVVGHGVSAAMYAGMLRSTLDAARRRDPEPREMLVELLDGIDFFDAAKYATLFYGLLLPDGSLRYVNAGHPPALWQRHDGRIDPLPATGFFLSTVFRDRPHTPGDITLATGDRLLVYTDGASEACGPAGEELGADGLTAALAACRGLPLTGALDSLLDRVRDHCQGRPLDDDVTLLLVERTGS